MVEDLQKVYTVAVDAVIEKDSKIADQEAKRFFFFQGDYKTATLIINYTENGNIVDLTGRSVTVAFKKLDGTSVIQNDETGVSILDADAGQIKIEVSQQALAVKGVVKGQISVSDVTGIISESTLFYFSSRESLANNAVESHDELPIAQTVASHTVQLASTPRLSNTIEKGWAFTKEEPYTAWTWNNVLYDEETDEVVLIYHSKVDHGGSGGRLLMRKLKNGILSDYTVVGEVEGRGCVTSGSQLLVNGTYAMIVKETEGGVNNTVGIFFYKSIDKGKTWVKNEILIDGATITPRDINDCYQTSNGRILTNCTLADGKVYTLYSDDEGVTWNKTWMQNNSGKVDPLEGKYMQLNSSTIIMVMRASGGAVYNGNTFGFAEPALFAKSTDNGLNWTPLVESTSILDMSANNCAILKNDNSIELFYCSRYRPDGVHGSLYHSITTHEEAENGIFGTPVKIADGYLPVASGDFGYPGVAKDKNGYIHLFFYDKDDTGVNIKYIFGKSYDHVGSIKDVEYAKNNRSLNDMDKLLGAISNNAKITLSLDTYDNGDEKIAITNGWVAGYSVGTGTIVKNADSLQLTVSDSGTVECRKSYIPDNGIDVTDVDFICADVDVISITGADSIASAGISVYNKKTPIFTSDGRVATVFFTKLGSGTIKVDVSALTGVVYPAIMANKSSIGAGSIDFKCYKVWTENNDQLVNVMNDLYERTQTTPTIKQSTILYEEGREKVWLTKGWVAGYSAGTGTITKNADNLQLSVNDAGVVDCRKSYIPDGGIDITNVSYIYAVVDITSITGTAGIASASVSVYNKKAPTTSTDGRIATVFASTLGINTIKCDVRDLQGIVYPAIMANKSSSGAGSVDFKCYKVWTETI